MKIVFFKIFIQIVSLAFRTAQFQDSIRKLERFLHSVRSL